MAKVKEGIVSNGLSGRVGNAVFVRTSGGTVLRDRPFVNNPNTPKQSEARVRLGRVSHAWKSMSLAQAAAWREFAQAQGERSAQLLFNRLGIKFLQASPGSALPMVPPSGVFPGDAVRFSVGASGGFLQITGDRANAPGVLTEVLIQRLPSVHCRTYADKYRTAGFFAFGASPVTLPLAPGVWAVATRFVFAATGQSTELIEIGRVVG